MANSDTERRSKLGECLPASKVRIIVWPEGQLVINGDPILYAKELHSQMDYFGAFAVIHSMIEFWMQRLYQSYVRYSRGFAESIKLLKAMKEAHPDWRYQNLVPLLEGESLIGKKEAKEIREFNELRNRILHRLAKYSYDTGYKNFVTKSEADRSIDVGLSLTELLMTKASDWLEKSRPSTSGNQPKFDSQLSGLNQPQK